CGGALILIFQILKEIKVLHLSLSQKNLLFFSGILFMVAIFLNIIIPKLQIAVLGKMSNHLLFTKDQIHIKRMAVLRNESGNENSTDLSIIKKQKTIIKLTHNIELVIIILMLAGIVLLGFFLYYYLFS